MIRWSVCISTSQKNLFVLFSGKDSGLCIHHLFVWSNLGYLHNSQWIAFSTHWCLVLYYFCANLLHSLIIGLIVLSLSVYNLHLLFCCIFDFTSLVLMVLFCVAIRRNSDSLLRFHFLSHVHVFSWLSLEMYIQLFFFPFLFSSYCCSEDPCVDYFVSVRCNQSCLLFFSCSLRYVSSIYQRCLKCWRVHFLLLFLTHLVCLHHLWDELLFFSWMFHISVSWWSFTSVWVKISFLKSLGLFSVFWPILTML